MSQFQLTNMRTIKKRELITVLSNIEYIEKRERKHYSFIPDNNAISIISEVKKSSPTAELNQTVDVTKQAAMYSEGGAVAISVLLDKTYFSGSYCDLAKVCKTVQLPVLAKEFIYYPEQIELAYLCGADLVLLIAQTLTDSELTELYSFTKEKKMSSIVEINTEEEIERVMKLDPDIVMVNMRNLNTLEISIENGIEVLKKVPDSVIRISASGISTAEDVKKVYESSGVSNFLVGSSLMKSNDPAEALRRLANVS